MKKTVLTLALGALAVSTSSMAEHLPKHNYPTRERVEFVYQCMKDHGGTNYTTLYKCSCVIDKIADKLSYDQYIILQTYQRGQHAHGERPEVLREGKLPHQSRAKLAVLKHQADKACLLSSTGNANNSP